MQKADEKTIWPKKMSKKLRVHICWAEGLVIGSFPVHYNTLVQLRMLTTEKDYKGKMPVTLTKPAS